MKKGKYCLHQYAIYRLLECATQVIFLQATLISPVFHIFPYNTGQMRHVSIAEPRTSALTFSQI